MKTPIILNDNNDAVGYDLIPETEEDYKHLAIIRNMIFFGIEENIIKYDGREMNIQESYKPKDIKRLKFRKQSYKDFK